jgi:allophanate hydrolase subunit 2
MVGNKFSEMVIELSNAAVEIIFSIPSRVAIVGAPVRGANSCFDASPGQKLALDAPPECLRVYLAVTGGWIPDGIDSVLGRSGRRLSAGDVLEHGEVAPTSKVRRLASPPDSLRCSTLRIIGGTHLRLTVSNDSDRTGIRLDGLLPQEAPELPSEPVCPGTIQRTPSGQLIVIGPDGPTIGGYPRMGYVCAADLDRLAHLRPGQEVSLVPISLEEARALSDRHEEESERRLALLRIADP